VTTFLGQGQVLVRMIEYTCWNVTLCITKINVFLLLPKYWPPSTRLSITNALDNKLICIHKPLVRDSSAVWRLFVRLAGVVGRQSTFHKENSGFAAPTLGLHVSWLSDFIFYLKPLYKSLHQSFFYSFITILSSESSVTLDYSTIFP
jgi:hypothetical protein